MCFVIQHRASGNYVRRRGGVVGMTVLGWLPVYTSLGFLYLSDDCDFFCYVADMTRSSCWLRGLRLQVMLLAVRGFIVDMYIK